MSQPTSEDLFAEKIAEKVCQHFKSLPKQGKPSQDKNEWTTMASIVQTEGEQLKVVAVGTGTRCLGQNELSDKGDLLCDSHAEVIARRSFLLYLYDQLFLALSNKSSILFQLQNKSSFDLDPSIKFHLFISHLPCGDAAIFDLPPADEDDADPAIKKRKIEVCQNRTGAKLKIGSDYEDIQISGKCRIKPGKGDPTLSMSCSDKIGKWQVLGLQGSLLGFFMKTPATFSSIVIGSQVSFSSKSLKRAVFNRFHDILDDTTKATHICPDISQSQVNFMEFPPDGTPTPGTISGYLKCSSNKFVTEVTVNGRKQGVTKKNSGKPSSRSCICSKNLYQLFIKAATILKETSPVSIIADEMTTYEEVKKLNSEYFRLWNHLKQSNTLEGWTCKPHHLKMFNAKDM